MRTPLWEQSAGALAALLNSGAPLNKCDLYRLTLASGQVLRWSGHDLALQVNGELFTLGPGIERTRCRWTVGAEVDTLTLDLYVDAARPVPVNGTPLLAYAAAGGLAGATVELIRGFWGIGASGPVGTLLWFKGSVSEIPELTRGHMTVTVKSLLERLSVKVPRQVYQSQCLATVYDSECGLTRATFTTNGVTTTVATLGRTQFGTNLAQAAGFFSLGTITFTSGANAGVSRTVKVYGNGGITLLQPLPAQLAIGDAFSIVPGCDGLQATCSGKFNNLARFKGQPYIPKPETVL